MEYIIRFATEEDTDDIYKIEVASFDKPYTRDSLFQEFEISFSRFIVSVLSGEIIAYTIVWEIHDELQLNKIAVKKEYRRKGIGKSLIDFIMREGIKKNHKIIYIEVREKDHGARSFYKELGFIESGIRNSYYTDDNAVLMEKQLGH